MTISIKNELTGLINRIDFKIFEQFNSQNEYMGYLIHSMNMNIDAILHIKVKTQAYFAAEKVKMYFIENVFTEQSLQGNIAQKRAQLEYAEMMSNICIDSCMVHYKKTLKPDAIRRKKLADEYEKNFLGILNEKKT